MTIPFRPSPRSASGSTSGKKADMVRRAPRPPRLSPLAARRRRARGRHAPVRRSRGSRRGEVVLRGKTRNAGRSLSSPSASEPADGPLRRESQGILVFPFRTTPRRSRRGRRCRLRVRRAPRSWLTGAGATGMVTRRQCWSSCFQDALPSQRRAHAPNVRAAEGRPRAGGDHRGATSALVPACHSAAGRPRGIGYAGAPDVSRGTGGQLGYAPREIGVSAQRPRAEARLVAPKGHSWRLR